MYRHICVPVDNSEHANRAIELAVLLGQAFGAQLTDMHVHRGRTPAALSARPGRRPPGRSAGPVRVTPRRSGAHHAARLCRVAHQNKARALLFRRGLPVQDCERTHRIISVR